MFKWFWTISSLGAPVLVVVVLELGQDDGKLEDLF